MMDTFAPRLHRRVAGGLLLAAIIALGLGAEIGTAIAHGEKSQEPYFRTRTVLWYDVTWSTNEIDINEEVVVEGKLRLYSDWPEAIDDPETVFVSNSIPGPVFARVESSLNGVPARQSFRDLEIGRDYEYRMVFQGRIPGRHHVHPALSIKGAGPVVGPGSFVEVKGDADDFIYSTETITGVKVDDLETWGLSRAVTWHLILVAIAAAWLLWWVRRPLLIPRHMALQKDREDLLTTKTDIKVGVGLLVGIVLLVGVAYFHTTSTYARLVPLQTGTMFTEPLPQPELPVKVRFNRAEYDVPGRALRMDVELENVGSAPLELGELTTANLRFIDRNVEAAVAGVDPNFPTDMLAPTDLEVSDPSPLRPGEIRTVRIIAADAAWEVERLASFLTDVDSQMGALLFFFDDTGQRHIAEVGGPILPVFTDL